ncbi:hypothetical protein [Streptomyces sp. C10-9-1]|uniref:hypothetical protein n=1 Tax=Streptomyces sp. C10-9-1 TaxID=1859285 RepID=UPI003F4A27CC
MATTPASSLIRKLRRDGVLSDSELSQLQRAVDRLETASNTSHETSKTHHMAAHHTRQTDHHTSHPRELAIEIEGLEE